MLRDLFHLGPFTLRFFGLALVTAFAVGAWISFRRARRMGLPESLITELVQVTLVGGILGARIQYVVGHWGEFASEPLRALAIWEGGLTYFGGAILAAIGAIWWGRRRGVPAMITADLLSPAVALGEGIGRIGCFMNGCCFGKASDVPWAVQFPPGSFADSVLGPVHVHPSQLYQSAWGFGVAALLFLLGFKKRPGTVFWSLVILLPLGRVLLDPFRYYDAASCVPVAGASIPVSRIIAAALVLVGVAGLVVTRRRAVTGRRAVTA